MLMCIRDLFMAELAFTDHRLLGRLHTKSYILFRQFDIPLEEISTLSFYGGRVEIQTPDKQLVFLTPFRETRLFVNQVNDYISTNSSDQSD